MNPNKIFRVAIVGRPNVGKSTLFNRLLGRSVSIVDAASGITRDRLYGKVSADQKQFELIDTGGIFEGTESKLDQALLDQVEQAFQEAKLILFTLDAKMGLHPMDIEIHRKLKLLNKPILYVVNKIDHVEHEPLAYEFMKLGIKTFFAVSAIQKRGIDELEKAILTFVPEEKTVLNPGFKISFVGKPNVGKSSLVNRILDKNQTVVSEIPGTTRDSVYLDFMYQDTLFTLIDTAGLTRRGRVKERVQECSIHKTLESVSASNLVVLMLDAGSEIEQQDLRLSRLIFEAGRCLLIVVNKWDLLKNVRQEHYQKYLYKKLPWVGFAPVLFVSALKGKNHENVMATILHLKKEAFKRIPTAQLNEFLEKVLSQTPPPSLSGKYFRIYYATQVSVDPPTFILFVNRALSLPENYFNFLRNQLRSSFGLAGMPIRFKLKLHEKNFQKT